MDYPWDRKELDMTEQLSFHFTSLLTQEWNLGLLRLQADSLSPANIYGLLLLLLSRFSRVRLCATP